MTFNEKSHIYNIRVHGVVDKLWQPSCTGILGVKGKPALTNWAAKKSLEYVGKKLGTYESKLGAPPFTIDTKEIHSWLAEAADSWNESEETTIGSLVHRVFESEVKYRAGLGPKPSLPIVLDPITMPGYNQAMIDSANLSINAGFAFLDEHKVEPYLLERPLWSPITGVVGTPDFIGKIDGELCVADWKTSKRIYAEYRLQLAKLCQMYHEEFQVLPLIRWAINTRKDGGLEHEKYGVDSYQDDLNSYDACTQLYQWDRQHDSYKRGTPVQILGDLDKLVPRPNVPTT